MNGATAPDIEHRDHSHRPSPTLFVHEFVAGGGLTGQPLPGPLLAQGTAMLHTLLTDLAADGERRLVTTRDARIDLDLPAEIEAVPIGADQHDRTFRRLARRADEVWVIAPESNGHLAALTETAEVAGARVIGSTSRAVRAVSDKLRLAALLARECILTPRTWADADAEAALPSAGSGLVVKPRWGAGCEGVRLVRRPDGLRSSLSDARRAGLEVVVQEFVTGQPASLSLVCVAGRAAPLGLSAQEIREREIGEGGVRAGGFREGETRGSAILSYEGGRTPLEHAAAGRALEVGRRICERIPGLAGYVGVDLVLTDDGRAVVIEVNPRLTTSYVGLRAATDLNLAGLILRAVTDGELSAAPPPRRAVRYDVDGALELAGGA